MLKVCLCYKPYSGFPRRLRATPAMRSEFTKMKYWDLVSKAIPARLVLGAEDIGNLGILAWWRLSLLHAHVRG